MKFATVFIIVLTVFLALVLYEGFRSAAKNKGEHDYLVAGRSMGAWVGGASIAATQMSAGTFVGTMGIHYLTGSSFLMPTIGIWLAFIFAGFVIAPKLHRYIDRRGALTFPDFIGDRYGQKLPRVIITILLIGAYVVFLSAQYQAGGIVFEQVFGIPFYWGSTLLMVFIVLYTVVGGMTAVMRTDFIQQIVMSGAVVIGVPFAINSAGGLANLSQEFASVGGDFAGWHYGWVDLLGFLMGFGFAAMVAPVLLMRFYAMRDRETCAKGSLVAVFFTMITFGCVAVIGMSMRVISPDLENADLASSVFATDVVPSVLGALMLTAVIAAVLSTVDSVLLVIGPAVSHDLYAKFIRPDASERQRMVVNRVATIALGVLPIILTFMQLDVVQFIVLAYAALIGSTVFAPLVFGMFWRKANRFGAIFAMVGGFGVCLLWYLIGQPFVSPVIPGILVNVLAMLIVCPLTKRSDPAVLKVFFDSEVAPSGRSR
ncbi:sodium/solute symporter [Brevibacterium sp. RIT 803]|uniref:sodium:solute symporter family protein n=1 Tax=Brevibacterium sp. RIT 803 TaxID=2810210 RepID=UPI00194E787E|nr:sodium/solute symporter [Brevibacterium sp. RIT 803]MBM6588865.1 sodium/solute symporter [Brevibacterium sp. RIT 803]